MSVEMAAVWGFTGLELARWLPSAAGSWWRLLTGRPAGIVEQSLRILLHVVSPCGLDFSQHGSSSKRKEAEAARPAKTWTQRLQNITFTASSHSKQSPGEPQFTDKEN